MKKNKTPARKASASTRMPMLVSELIDQSERGRVAEENKQRADKELKLAVTRAKELAETVVELIKDSPDLADEYTDHSVVLFRLNGDSYPGTVIAVIRDSDRDDEFSTARVKVCHVHEV